MFLNVALSLNQNKTKIYCCYGCRVVEHRVEAETCIYLSLNETKIKMSSSSSSSISDDSDTPELSNKVHGDKEESDYVEDDGEFDIEKVIEHIKNRNKKKKKGRKSQWSTQLTNDLVDIILSDENLKEKLVFTNVKNAKNGEYYGTVIKEMKNRCESNGSAEFVFSVKQTRDKFKRCIGTCRNAAMKIKKESGIKRFQEEKGLGAWFPQLFSVCKSMDNCQPEQTIEPGLSDDDANEEDKSSGHNTSNESSTSCANISASSCPNTSTTSKRTFVPIHETSKKPKRCSSKDVLFETMNSIHEALSNDPTKDLIDYMKEEAKQQKTRDDAFLKLMERIFPPNPAPLHFQFLVLTAATT